MPKVTPETAVGRAPEDLSLTECFALAGKWIALERYAPPEVAQVDGRPEVALRLRRIRAIADTVEECIGRLRAAGHNPNDFEFTLLKPPYGGFTS